MSRGSAAAIHLAASFAVFSVCALLVFRFWYPPPFDRLSGGSSLLLLIATVDVVMGPALTFVVANPVKSKRELRIDLCVIVLLQVAALAYGVHTMAVARPVFQSFEIDRFRVVTASDLDHERLVDAPPELRSLSWAGPKVIAAVQPKDPREQLKSLELGMAGLDLSLFPANWVPYSSQCAMAWQKARSVSVLMSNYPQVRDELAHVARATGRPEEELRFLPMVSRHASWAVIVAPPDARIVGYLPVDAFF